MTKVILLSMLLISNLAMAASRDAIKAVLDNPEVQALSDISSISEAATYKCPNCYDIKVVGFQEVVSGLPAEEKFMIVRTEGNLFSEEITTTVVNSSK